MPFFNTCKVQGREKADGQRLVRGQERDILDYFRSRPQSGRTNRELRLIFESGGRKIEQASMSRSLTDLTDAGYLEKSKETVRCNVTNMSAHTWRLASRRVPEQERLF